MRLSRLIEIGVHADGRVGDRSVVHPHEIGERRLTHIPRHIRDVDHDHVVPRPGELAPGERTAVGSGALFEVIGEIRGVRTAHHFERSGFAVTYLGSVGIVDALDRAAHPIRRRRVEGVSYVKEERPPRVGAAGLALEALAHLTHARPGALVKRRVLEHAGGETAVKEVRRRRRGRVYAADRDGDGIARGVRPAERTAVVFELYRVNSVCFEVERESRLRPRISRRARLYVVVRARGARSLVFRVDLREIGDMCPSSAHAPRRRRDIQIAHAVVARRFGRIAVPDRQRQFFVVVLPVREESRLADHSVELDVRGFLLESLVGGTEVGLGVRHTNTARGRKYPSVLRHRVRNVRSLVVRRTGNAESECYAPNADSRLSSNA